MNGRMLAFNWMNFFRMKNVKYLNSIICKTRNAANLMNDNGVKTNNGLQQY